MADHNRPLCIIRAENQLGEGPRWNMAESALYWVDIEGGQVHRYVPDRREHTMHDVGAPVSALAFVDNGTLLLAQGDMLILWERATGAITTAVQIVLEHPKARFNDGVVDGNGRFWVGTLSDELNNHLYRLDCDLSLVALDSRIGVANGLGWSPDGRAMYFTDSARGKIYIYDFGLEHGVIANQRVFATVPEDAGVPDGLCVDSEGFVWSAHWDGWRITRYDPAGRIERVIQMPVQRPTSCTFGGPDLSQLYVTSARIGLSVQELARQPLAGGLFRIDPGVSGQPENYFRFAASAGNRPPRPGHLAGRR